MGVFDWTEPEPPPARFELGERVAYFRNEFVVVNSRYDRLFGWLYSLSIEGCGTKLEHTMISEVHLCLAKTQENTMANKQPSFKVGDRVEYHGHNDDAIGKHGTVNSFRGDGNVNIVWEVPLNGATNRRGIRPSYLKLINRQENSEMTNREAMLQYVDEDKRGLVEALVDDNGGLMTCKPEFTKWFLDKFGDDLQVVAKAILARQKKECGECQ